MSWTEPLILKDKLYRKFKREQKRAEAEKLEQYEVFNQPMLTTFGKYLLEFVERHRKLRGLSIYKFEVDKHGDKQTGL